MTMTMMKKHQQPLPSSFWYVAIGGRECTTRVVANSFSLVRRHKKDHGNIDEYIKHKSEYRYCAIRITKKDENKERKK